MSLQDPFLTNQNTVTSTTQYYLERKPVTIASQFDSMVNEIEDLIPQKRAKNIFNTESLLEIRNIKNMKVKLKNGRVSVAESQPQPFANSKLYQFKTMQENSIENEKENLINLSNIQEPSAKGLNPSNESRRNWKI